MFICNFISQTSGQVFIKTDDNRCLEGKTTNKHVSQHYVDVQITEENYGVVTHNKNTGKK
jgi:hypothetical protein